MADRYRGEPYRGEREYGREDRGVMERAGDQVRSWFGDDEAERRRRMDEREQNREREHERQYGRSPDERPSERAWNYPAERGWSGERWQAGDRWARDLGRPDYDRGPVGQDRMATGSGTNYGGYGYPSLYGAWSDAEGRERWREGPFVGRGPKGYQRSDARINEDVCDRLTDAPDIDASNLEVMVKNGEVTLSGTVRGRSEKRRAEDLVENVTGVREVHNNLRVSSALQEPSGQR